MTHVIEPTAPVQMDLYVDGATKAAEQPLRVTAPAQPPMTVGYAAAATHREPSSTPWLPRTGPSRRGRRSAAGREIGAEGLREFMDTHSVAFPSG